MKTKEQKKEKVKVATKGKMATPLPQPQAKALGRTRIEVSANQLRPAPWNPRPEITSENVADITASIREIGLIQPLVVMKDPEKKPTDGVDFYLVVAGHRRFKGCVDAGLSPIPCDAIDCDVSTAKRVTMIENLQRRDVDPLMEADLIAGLIADGMTQTEIAAETGRGERWVARRANLIKLSKSWRKRVEGGEQFTVDCLEHVAAYPEEMQERLKDAKGYSYYYGGTPETITWQQISYQFRNASRDLKSAAFNTADCLGCLDNTGCCPDLFDQDGGKNAKLGRCLCDRCWRDKHEAHVAETVAKAEKKGVKIVKRKPKWGYSATDHKTKTNTTLYVYKDGDQMVAKWYKPPEIGEKKAKSKEEKRKEREAKRREDLLLAAKDEAVEKFTDWVDEHAIDGDWPKWFVDAAVADMVREIRDYGAGNLEAATDAFAANTNFTASDAEADKLYKEYLAARAEAKAAEPNDGLAGIHETGLPAAPDPDDMEEETT
ncbi:MAG: ParB/RepB/Spo0J family partition protein [Kiritimatiellae bacterium]|nr:ParB/RepB/Spo0J family partition protein [Kiritimatiellia bacterium]